MNNKFNSLEEICTKFSYIYHDCLDYSKKLHDNIIKLFNVNIEDIENEIFSESCVNNFTTEYEKQKWTYWIANYYLKIKNDANSYQEILTKGCD